jgi:hypothetical protein
VRENVTILFDSVDKTLDYMLFAIELTIVVSLDPTIRPRRDDRDNVVRINKPKKPVRISIHRRQQAPLYSTPHRPDDAIQESSADRLISDTKILVFLRTRQDFCPFAIV